MVRSCTLRNPAQAGYLTEDILWDNVLLGDYQQIDLQKNWSEGGPLVHIRAIAEGGTAEERRNNPNQYEVTFHRTFYSRFLPPDKRTFDGRQPLPALFAARWIRSEAAEYRTSFKIWREAGATQGGQCGDYARQGRTPFVESAIFDEDENPEGLYRNPDEFPYYALTMPATSLTRVEDTNVFPRPTFGAIAGWVYLNLDESMQDDLASQGWVVASMRAEERFSVDMDAYALGNGCTPQTPESRLLDPSNADIGPAPNANP